MIRAAPAWRGPRRKRVAVLAAGVLAGLPLLLAPSGSGAGLVRAVEPVPWVMLRTEAGWWVAEGRDRDAEGPLRWMVRICSAGAARPRLARDDEGHLEVTAGGGRWRLDPTSGQMRSEPAALDGAAMPVPAAAVDPAARADRLHRDIEKVAQRLDAVEVLLVALAGSECARCATLERKLGTCEAQVLELSRDAQRLRIELSTLRAGR